MGSPRSFVRSRFASLALTAGLLACGPSVTSHGDDDDDDDSVGDDAGVAGGRLELSPAGVSLQVIDDLEATQVFIAELVEDDGTRHDVSADTTFSVAPRFGAFFGNTFTTAGAGGLAQISATGPGGITGSTTAEIHVTRVRVEPGAPATAPGIFAGATVDPTRAPTIVYPATGVIMPNNIGRFETHWRDASNNNLYEVSLVSRYVELRVYVSGSAAAGRYVELSPEDWDAAGTAGEREISTRVRGLNQASPATMGETSLAVGLTNEPIAGGLYYWASQSQTGESGIYRHDLAEPGAAPEPYLTASDSPNGCIGCHALSKSGERMSVTYGGNGTATFIDVASQTPVIATTSLSWNFAAYSADEETVATVSNGTMVLRDADTAAELTTIHSANGGTYATHPEFAPDNATLAYTLASSFFFDFQIDGGQIITRSYNAVDHSFGEPTTLVSTPTDSYYPSWSPDSQWLLYTQASGQSYDNPNASLWVIKADGSAPAIQLTAANVAGATNSWSRFAPFAQSYGEAGEPMYWITFSSRRDFGVRMVGLGTPQVWMAPFFPDRAALGEDPTGPAFRLPFQDLTSNNHIAQWTETVVIID